MHLLLTFRVELVLSTKFLIWHGITVSVYSLKSPLSSADFTIYAPGIGTLSYSLISSGENSAFAHFAAAIANHYNLAFSFHQVPITAGWTEAA